jgi:hypothetical protein
MESYFQFRQNMKSHVNAIARANPVAPTVFWAKVGTDMLLLKVDFGKSTSSH